MEQVNLQEIKIDIIKDDLITELRLRREQYKDSVANIFFDNAEA